MALRSPEYSYMTRDRYIVLLTKLLASAYVVAAIGKDFFNAAMKIGGFN